MPTVVKAQGDSIGKRLTIDQQADIAETIERQVVGGKRSITDCIRALAKKHQKNEVTIWRFVKSIRDTTSLSRLYFRAKAIQMSAKIVKSGDVSQLIDVLSRPNIGVLAPIVKNDGGLGGGISISVAAITCGGVQQSTTELRSNLSQLPILEMAQLAQGGSNVQRLPAGNDEDEDEESEPIPEEWSDSEDGVETDELATVEGVEDPPEEPEEPQPISRRAARRLVQRAPTK